MTTTVKAVQWSGENLKEMKDLLTGIVYCDDFTGEPQVYSSRIEPYLFASGSSEGYNIVQFYAWGDDQEVDPGLWVVVYEDLDGEIMDDEQFNKMGFRKKA